MEGWQRLPERVLVASRQRDEADRTSGLDVGGGFEIAELVTRKVINLRFAGILGG